ncbi:uncharacterized protein [Paramormyrops kingsleyae]|uniref:uncharacterized protein n=1 Tax=Paramormyrops kingsleyae TaxID=1676925 RepID=UPI003B96CC7E
MCPPDSPHVTLFYDRENTEWYEELFAERLEGHKWQVASENIYVGPEGVASATLLTSGQLPWYMMGQEAVPHVSLALHPKHQAKNFGPMVKRARETKDWVQTQIPQASFSPSCSTYCIQVAAQDTALLQHEQIARDPGREKMDHPKAAALLASLPDSLWSTSPTDVGLISCAPVQFQLQPGEGPLWLRQYPHEQAAEDGIAETIVLEPSTSLWNTPILPVEKAGIGKYRMAHDLCAINNLLLTPTVPVPNPYVALTNLTPQQKWFTCIDLANVFFCLPLAEQCRDIFSFTYKGCQLRYTRLPQGFALSPGIFNQALKQAVQGCPLPDGVTLIQYVDDLLIAAPTSEAALQATQSVLLRQSEKGFKIQETRPGNQPPEPHTAEWVLLRVIKRKWSEPRWTGPFRVTERTSHAVRLKGKGDTWFHWSQCAAAEEPGRTTAEIQKDLREDTQSVSSAEPDATQVSTEGQNSPLT